MNLISNDYLMHYGVKGMKWGVRHDPELVGRRTGRTQQYYSRARGAATTTANRVSSTYRSSYTQRRLKAAKKVAIGAGVVAGGLLAAYGGMKVGKLLSSEAGRAAIKRGAKSLALKADRAVFKTRNAVNLGHKVVTTPLRMARGTPVGRVVRTATRPIRMVKNFNPIPKSLRSTNLGKAAFKGFVAASMASDINTVNQWSKGVKKRGKLTKKDVIDISKDIINPIPDNIPGLAKKNKY